MTSSGRAASAFNSEHVLDEFELAWQGSARPDLNNFFLRAPLAQQQELLIELVKIDLEYSWKNSNKASTSAPRGVLPRRPRIEDYLRSYPELGTLDQLPLDLIVEEFRVRRLAGDEVEPEEYRLRFPSQERELYRLLKQAHRQLEADYSRLSWSSDAGIVIEPEVSLTEFLERLQRSGICQESQLAELRRSPAANCRDLSVELIRRKILTHFQADLLCTPNAIPLLLDDYVLVDRLGKGGMGIVYRGRHRRMQREVAIKILPETLACTPELVKRFEREAVAAARLNHPNIVTAFDAGEHAGIHFLAMEYVDGIDLGNLQRKTGNLSEEEAIATMLQCAHGLQFAHEQGVIHRDIKPTNILVDRQGVVKLLDLGLARLEQTLAHAQSSGLTEELTLTGMAMGTIDYMSPEQTANTKLADARSDIYSLGCTLHFLLAGKPMYAGENTMSKIIAHREQAPPRLNELTGISAELDAVFQKMVAKRPLDRFENAGELTLALLSIRKDTGPLGFLLRRRVTVAIGSGETSTVVPADGAANADGTEEGTDDGLPVTTRQNCLLPGELRTSGTDFPVVDAERRTPRTVTSSLSGLSARVPRTGSALARNSDASIPSYTPPEHYTNRIRLQETQLSESHETDVIPVKSTANNSSLSWTAMLLIGLTLSVSAALYFRPRLPPSTPTPQGLHTTQNFDSAPSVHEDQHAFARQLADRLGGTYDPEAAQLVLAHTQVTNADLKALSAADHLRQLDLSETEISDDGLGQLSHLKALESLNLHGTPIIGSGFSAWESPSALTSLDLGETSVNDVAMEALPRFSGLQRLNLNRTAVTDRSLAAISHLKQLEQLDLEETRITDRGLFDLAHHQQLSRLNLVGCKGVTDRGLTEIATCPSINRLYLGRTAISDAGISQLLPLTNLQQLWLEHTQVTGDSLGALSQLQSLKWLSLLGTDYTAEQVQNLQQLLPECRINQ